MFSYGCGPQEWDEHTENRYCVTGQSGLGIVIDERFIFAIAGAMPVWRNGDTQDRSRCRYLILKDIALSLGCASAPDASR